MRPCRMTEREIKKRNAILHVAKGVIVFLYAGLFTGLWQLYYTTHISAPYFNKGNYVVCTLYLIFYFMFAKIYGGFQMGNRDILATKKTTQICGFCAA